MFARKSLATLVIGISAMSFSACGKGEGIQPQSNNLGGIKQTSELKTPTPETHAPSTLQPNLGPTNLPPVTPTVDSNSGDGSGLKPIDLGEQLAKHEAEVEAQKAALGGTYEFLNVTAN